MDNKKLTNITGWLVFAIAFIVYIMSAERTGSLWDCGEFITGAYKLEVVHPPGAPLFLVLGRMFTFPAEILFPNDPEMIAFSVNIMSGLCTALAAMFICWITIILSKIALVGRLGNLDQGGGGINFSANYGNCLLSPRLCCFGVPRRRRPVKS